MNNGKRMQRQYVGSKKRRLLVITAAFIVPTFTTVQASTAPQTAAVPPINSASAAFSTQEHLVAAANDLNGIRNVVSSSGGGNGSSASDDDLESSSSDFEDEAEQKWSDDDEEHVVLSQQQQHQHQHQPPKDAHNAIPQLEVIKDNLPSVVEQQEIPSAMVEQEIPPVAVELVEQQEEFDELTDDASESVPSQPLKTLKKLQQMLDETDYMTTRTTSMHSNSRTEEAPRNKARKSKRKSQTPPSAVAPVADQSPFDWQQQEVALPPPPLPSQEHWYEPNQSSDTTPQSYNMQPQQQYEQHSQQHPPPQKPEIPVQPFLPENIASKHPPPSTQQQQHQAEQVRQLWTSKDRSKYKKIQSMQRRADEERRRLEQHLLLQPNSSDDEGVTDEGMTDTDDGLQSYTLPNLPVYMSDAEGEGSDAGEYQASTQPEQQMQPSTNPASAYPQQRQHDMYAYAQQQQQQQQQQQYGYPRAQYPPPPHDQQLQQQQQPPPYMAYQNHQNTGYAPYPPNMPYSAYNPQQQYSQPQQMTPQQQQQHQQMTPQQQQQYQQMLASQYAAAWAYYPRPSLRIPPSHAQAATKVAPAMSSPAQIGPAMFEQQQQQLIVHQPDIPQSLAEATSQVNFDSIQKVALLSVAVASLAYCAVSPRHLPLAEYNRLFYDNLRLVALATIAPMANFLLVCDARENDINSVITSFYTSFTVGYCLAFILEILLTTVLRLGVFACWEPNIFKLSPKVPRLVLPWVVRENKYRPKRITLFAADFLTSCVASPIVEEFVKLKILQLSVRLPRNFVWYTKVSTNSKNKKKRKRRVAEAASKNPGEPEITNINSYVTHMLAVSTGLKLCDSARRILMYTKTEHLTKSFYAFVRGMFPIHELCGTMTALALAKRDILGVDMPTWKMLFPAVFIHAMANFRGMKPIYKWNAATPWSEMQLSPWHAADDSTLAQLMNKGFAKLMWLIILGRVLGYCIKNYYLISRQARKRTTTYAGKQAAFSAELAAAEMLKKTKDKK